MSKLSEVPFELLQKGVQALEEAFKEYQKPVFKRTVGINFVFRPIHKGWGTICNQCAGCHGCR